MRKIPLKHNLFPILLLAFSVFLQLRLAWADDTTVHESYVRDDHGGPGKTSDLTDETAYIDPQTGAKGWYLGENNKPITKEAFVQNVEANQNALMQRAVITSGEAFTFQVSELGLTKEEAMAQREKVLADLKNSQADQLNGVKADASRLTPMQISKPLVSKEDGKQ